VEQMKIVSPTAKDAVEFNTVQCGAVFKDETRAAVRLYLKCDEGRAVELSSGRLVDDDDFDEVFLVNAEVHVIEW
jgi:hypothetical protein